MSNLHAIVRQDCLEFIQTFEVRIWSGFVPQRDFAVKGRGEMDRLGLRFVTSLFEQSFLSGAPPLVEERSRIVECYRIIAGATQLTLGQHVSKHIEMHVLYRLMCEGAQDEGHLVRTGLGFVCFVRDVFSTIQLVHAQWSRQEIGWYVRCANPHVSSDIWGVGTHVLLAR